MKDLSVGILNELYGNMLTDRQCEFVRCYYDFDLSLGEIADQYGMTRQAVADALRKGEHALRKCEDQLGFFAKLSEIKNSLERVKSEINSGDLGAANSILDGMLENL